MKYAVSHLIPCSTLKADFMVFVKRRKLVKRRGAILHQSATVWNVTMPIDALVGTKMIEEEVDNMIQNSSAS